LEAKGRGQDYWGKTSSDVVLGRSLFTVREDPSEFSLTLQPEDLTVREADPASLRVGVAGWGAVYQWFREGEGDFTAFDNIPQAYVVRLVGCAGR